MGQPVWLKASHPYYRERTRGTETSQYPEEEKEISISVVVAIEPDRAQTVVVAAMAVL